MFKKCIFTFIEFITLTVFVLSGNFLTIKPLVIFGVVPTEADLFFSFIRCKNPREQKKKKKTTKNKHYVNNPKNTKRLNCVKHFLYVNEFSES